MREIQIKKKTKEKENLNKLRWNNSILFFIIHLDELKKTRKHRIQLNSKINITFGNIIQSYFKTKIFIKKKKKQRSFQEN